LERMLVSYARSTTFLDRSAAPGISTTAQAARSGSHIGPWRLEKELGSGGMGVVYLAARADGSFERRVAIKLLRHDRVDNLLLNRFHKERRILAQLDHPHIAAILDAGMTSDGDPYFVMDYV